MCLVASGFILLTNYASGAPSLLPGLGQTKKIEAKIAGFTKELEELPQTSLTKRPWSLGFQSTGSSNPESPVTIEIDLGEAQPVDLIVLLPAIVLESKGQYGPRGFPRHFLLECILPNGEAQVLADHRVNPYEIEGIEPQLFERRESTEIRGIRLTATKLEAHSIWGEGDFRIAMSEIMVFVEEKNVALWKSISVEGSRRGSWGWDIAQLVDGFLTFSPVDRKVTERSQSFTFFGDEGELFFDLGKEVEVTSFRIWPVAPQYHRDYVHTSGHGFPTHTFVWAVWNVNTPDRVDGLRYATDPKSIAVTGSNPFHRPFGEPVTARYFRFVLGKPAIKDPTEGDWISVSEIELFSHGVNVTAGIAPNAKLLERDPDAVGFPDYHLPRLLTDGITEEGKIVPLKAWVKGIQRRFYLERKVEELRGAYHLAGEKERNAYRFFALILIGLVSSLILLVLFLRSRSRQKISAVREQIACDIHDQIGANLNSIALSQEILRRQLEQPTALQKELVENTIATARETADDAARIVRFLEGRKISESMAEQIQKSAELILGDIPFTCHFNDTQAIETLDEESKWDLLLFVKEALSNISKHARATMVQITTQKIGDFTKIEVSDDGRGLPSEKVTLVHLEKRAKRLGGQLKVESQSHMGTTLSVSFK